MSLRCLRSLAFTSNIMERTVTTSIVRIVNSRSEREGGGKAKGEGATDPDPVSKTPKQNDNLPLKISLPHVT